MTDFEKVLRETQSEETFKIISSSDEEFRNWLERLEEVAEEYSKLVTGNNVGRSGWIPCSERLPEKEGNVIGCFKTGTVSELSFYKGLFHGFYAYDTKVIAAWMPLPEPYRGKE